MRKGLLYVIMLLVSECIYAQGSYEVKVSNYERLELTFSATSKLEVSESTINGNLFSLVTIPGFDHSSEIGAPSLPTMRQMIEIPLCDGIMVQMVKERHVILDGDSLGVIHKVSPVQPSRCKTERRNANVLAFNDKIYGTNAFHGLSPVTTAPVGVARDRNLAEVVFSPVQYNPVTNQFLVYTEVEAELIYVNPDMEGTRNMKRLHYSPAFSDGAKTINTLGSGKAVTLTAPMRYLIVSHTLFRGRLDEFVSWKRRTGFIVDVVYTDDAAVGNTQTSIKNYLRQQYTSATAERPAPTYLLLVGDVGQIPAKSYSDDGDTYVSDLEYACWTSGDNIPDCYYGRFSAQNNSQLTAQLEKTLLYERYEFPDPSFLDRAILIAGVDGGHTGDHGYTHADPTMDYAAKLYVNGDGKSQPGGNDFYKFVTVTEYKNNTSINPNATNVTVKSNGLDSEIRNLCSNGAGWINYSAHGGHDSWSIPEFNNSQVASMTNTKKCGIMIGNCCLSGKFDESACFGETLLRRNNYCGAVGYIGGSSYTYWGEDVHWAMGLRNTINATMTLQYSSSNTGAYDHLFHTHGEDFSQWGATLGSIVMYGNMAVQGSSSSLKNYYWQIYHAFGDPSLMPWLTQAKEMPLSYNGFAVGATSVVVGGAPYSYVAITDADTNLLAAAFAGSDGIANLTLSRTMDSGSYVIAVTAQNYKPTLVELVVSDTSVMSSVWNETSITLKCYPNPAASTVMLALTQYDKEVQYDIVDISGRKVYTASVENGTTPLSVDVSAFIPGTYLVRATGSNLSLSSKILVAR